MKTSFLFSAKVLTLSAAALAAAVLPLSAADETKDKDKEGKADTEETKQVGPAFSEFKLGELITGPELKPEDLKGKAVVLEFWGVNCGPCLASLPEMAKLSKRHKDTIAFIGAHAQDATDDQVKAVVTKTRVPFTILKSAQSPVQFSGIPKVFVFDAEGKMLFDGHPGDKDFDRAVRNASKSAKDAAKPATASKL